MPILEDRKEYVQRATVCGVRAGIKPGDSRGPEKLIPYDSSMTASSQITHGGRASSIEAPSISARDTIA